MAVVRHFGSERGELASVDIVRALIVREREQRATAERQARRRAWFARLRTRLLDVAAAR